MSSSYFCCSSWTPSSLWTRRTPPVSKVLWWYSCKHTPLGVNIHLKKQGAPHQKCLYKCKHIWFLEKCHMRCNCCLVPWSGECWEKWWKGLWANTKQSSTLPNQTLSPIASLLPSSDPSCLLGQPSLQPCQQIHWPVEKEYGFYFEINQTLTQSINRTAIVDTWRSYTYGELHSYAAAIASSLQGRRGAR